MRDSSPPKIWFDDFAVGDMATSPHRRIGEDDVRAYVRFSNDIRPLLVADAIAAVAPMMVPRAFLFSLGVCLLLHGAGTYIPEKFIAFYGFDEIRFTGDAVAGDVIHSEAQVVDLTERGRNGLITYRHETSALGTGLLVTSTQRMLVARTGS